MTGFIDFMTGTAAAADEPIQIGNIVYNMNNNGMIAVDHVQQPIPQVNVNPQGDIPPPTYPGGVTYEIDYAATHHIGNRPNHTVNLVRDAVDTVRYTLGETVEINIDRPRNIPHPYHTEDAVRYGMHNDNGEPVRRAPTPHHDADVLRADVWIQGLQVNTEDDVNFTVNPYVRVNNDDTHLDWWGNNGVDDLNTREWKKVMSEIDKTKGFNPAMILKRAFKKRPQGSIHD